VQEAVLAMKITRMLTIILLLWCPILMIIFLSWIKRLFL